MQKVAAPETQLPGVNLFKQKYFESEFHKTETVFNNTKKNKTIFNVLIVYSIGWFNLT